MPRFITAALILCVPFSVALSNDERPNVVLIMADDVGVDAIGCYGGESYPTPNINKLAAGGMRFNHCYSMPSCHPTRICLMTGQYPRRLKNPKWGTFPRKIETNTFGAILQRAGYATAVAGKWQIAMLGADLQHPHRMGFDGYSLFGWHEGPRYHQPLIWQDGKRREGVKQLYGPDLYCDYLIDFMMNNRDKPFFAYYPMALCHDVTDDLDEPVPYGSRGRYDSFAEMASEMDRIIGKLVGAIDDMGLRKKTLILFTGDNGTPSGTIIRAENGKYVRDPVYSVYKGKRVRGGKTRLTNGGTNVPLIASWPGMIEPGRVTDDLVDFSDFLPTLVELSKAKSPAGVTLDGQSFAGRLLHDKPTQRQWAYAERPRNKYWVRTQRWKLYNSGNWYDMQEDEFEKNPLKREQLPQSANEAKQLLSKAMKSVSGF